MCTVGLMYEDDHMASTVRATHSARYREWRCTSCPRKWDIASLPGLTCC